MIKNSRDTPSGKSFPRPCYSSSSLIAMHDTCLGRLESPTFSVVGKIENFDQDFKKVIETIGMPMTLVETKNQSSVKVDRNIDDSLANRIMQVYDCDMRAFYP